MAYETSNSTTVNGLLEAFKNFALAQGWTIDTFEDVDTSFKWLALHKGTAYFNLITDDDVSGEIKIRGATGYAGGNSYDTQPGMRTDTYWSWTNDLDATPYVAYHFFAGDDFVHAVVEVASGRYVHFGIGTLDKAGVYDGGEYVFGLKWYLNHTTISGDGDSGSHSYPFGAEGVASCSQVRFTENDLSGTDTYRDWASLSGAPYSATTSLVAAGFSRFQSQGNSHSFWYWLMQRSPNYFNGVSPLLPITIACGRTNNLVSVLGAPKEMRMLRIDNLQPGQELTLGSDIWMIFPVKQKGEAIPSNTTPFSKYYGIAYKKVV